MRIRKQDQAWNCEAEETMANQESDGTKAGKEKVKKKVKKKVEAKVRVNEISTSVKVWTWKDGAFENHRHCCRSPLAKQTVVWCVLELQLE